MICACLPAIRALLSYWFPALFDITTRMASKNQLSNSVQLESQINRARRKSRQVDDDLDDEIIIQAPKARGQNMKIIRIKEFEEIPPPTPPKTPGSISGYSESRCSAGRDSDDEVEVLDARTAIPLRNVRENHNNRIAAQIAASRSRSGR
jgi:hypothetical protein